MLKRSMSRFDQMIQGCVWPEITCMRLYISAHTHPHLTSKCEWSLIIRRKEQVKVQPHHQTSSLLLCHSIHTDSLRGCHNTPLYCGFCQTLSTFIHFSSFTKLELLLSYVSIQGWIVFCQGVSGFGLILAELNCIKNMAAAL